MNNRSDLSEIGFWSEIKLDIIREYASAYSRIIAAQTQPRLKHVYIDGFSGSGVHVAKSTKDLVWGSPMSALLVEPAFKEYHFIDLDEGNIDALEAQVRNNAQGLTIPIQHFSIMTIPIESLSPMSFLVLNTKSTPEVCAYWIPTVYIWTGKLSKQRGRCARSRYS